MKILANDGISKSGIEAFEKAGFEVITTRVAQEQVANYVNNNKIEILLVRSATKVRRDIIDACPGLKVIGRGGVGMDNIDVNYAQSKGIHIVNTPDASSESVAELVFAHLLSGVRFLHDANRNMPLEGDTRFAALKQSYAKGLELRGKTLGIIGMGRIGQATAKMAIALGMRVIYSDMIVPKKDLKISFYNNESINVSLVSDSLEAVFEASDFISLHVPAQDDYVIGERELALMKDGVGIVNCARGGAIDEVALVAALESGKVSFAGLDVFESEPNPEIAILMNPKISLSPHIGASTLEAQERIGLELAKHIISWNKKAKVN